MIIVVFSAILRWAAPVVTRHRGRTGPLDGRVVLALVFASLEKGVEK